jgi:hypothetical protein
MVNNRVYWYKKVIIDFIVVAFLIVISLNSSCRQYVPPAHNVINPVVISDESGRQVVAFQNNGGEGPITHLEKIGNDGKVLWQVIQLDPSQPFKPYTSSPTELIRDGKDNIFVVWGLGNDIWIKKFDINGKSVWNNKIKIGNCSKLYQLKAIKDGQDGVIIGCYGEEGEFWSQKINSDGKSVWSPKYQMFNIAGFDLTTDSMNNVLLIYVTFERSIYIQKLDSSGSNIWGSPILLSTHNPSPKVLGPATASSSVTIYPGRAEPREYAVWLISHQSGGCTAGYSDTWGNTAIDRSLNFYKVNTEGNILWNKRLTPDSGDKNNLVPEYALSKVVGDNLGGIYILERIVQVHSSGNMDVSLVIHQIDSSGTEVINSNYGQVVTDKVWNVNLDPRYEFISDSSSGVIIIWVSSTRNQDGRETGAILRIQKLDRDGKKQWDESGIILSNDNVQNMNETPFLILDGSGGFIVSLGNSSVTGGVGSLVWRFGPDGKLIWKKMY